MQLCLNKLPFKNKICTCYSLHKKFAGDKTKNMTLLGLLTKTQNTQYKQNTHLLPQIALLRSSCPSVALYDKQERLYHYSNPGGTQEHSIFMKPANCGKIVRSYGTNGVKCEIK